MREGELEKLQQLRVSNSPYPIPPVQATKGYGEFVYDKIEFSNIEAF